MDDPRSDLATCTRRGAGDSSSTRHVAAIDRRCVALSVAPLPAVYDPSRRPKPAPHSSVRRRDRQVPEREPGPRFVEGCQDSVASDQPPERRDVFATLAPPVAGAEHDVLLCVCGFRATRDHPTKMTVEGSYGASILLYVSYEFTLDADVHVAETC